MWRQNLRYVSTRRLKNREAARPGVLHANRPLLAAGEVAWAVKLAGTFPLLAEDPHDGAIDVHAADPGLVGIDYARGTLVGEKRDRAAFAQRHGGGADYLGCEDGLAVGVILNAGAGKGQEGCGGEHLGCLHSTEAATRWLGVVRH